jgi:hypothetical protein
MARHARKRVVCISWDPALALTRELMLRKDGYDVVSAFGRVAGQQAAADGEADLLVLGYSVPREQKREFMRSFRRHSSAPILSLLGINGVPLEEATVGIPGDDPANFMRTVREMLALAA